MRSDHRRFGQLRPLRVTPNIQKDALGSLLFEMGETKVICSASVEAKVPDFLKGKGKGWVTAEYSLLPNSTVERVGRERGKIEGRTQEIQRLIGRSLRAVTDLQLLGERSVMVDCDVLQADGGTRCASITGGFLALTFALRRLQKRGELSELPVKRKVAAVSVVLKGGQPLLDPTYEEDSTCDLDANIVMDNEMRLIELQMTAEDHAATRSQLNAIMDLSEEGIRQLFEFQSSFLS